MFKMAVTRPTLKSAALTKSKLMTDGRNLYFIENKVLSLSILVILSRPNYGGIYYPEINRPSQQVVEEREKDPNSSPVAEVTKP